MTAEVTAAAERTAEVERAALRDVPVVVAREHEAAPWGCACGTKHGDGIDRHWHVINQSVIATVRYLRDANLLADPNLTAERDRARDIAVTLEGQVAAVRARIEEWEAEARCTYPSTAAHLRQAARQLRAALDPDPTKET